MSHSSRYHGVPSLNKISFDLLSADLLVHIFSFMNGLDSAFAKQCCLRFLFLLERYHMITPDLAVASTHTFNPLDCIKEALSELLAEPTIAFAFYKTQSNQDVHKEWLAEAKAALPKKCQLVAAHSAQVQVNVKGLVKHDDAFSIMLGSFPQTSTATFTLTQHDLNCKMRETPSDKVHNSNNNNPSKR